MNWAIIVSDVRIPLRRLEVSCIISMSRKVKTVIVFCVSLVKTVIVFCVLYPYMS